MPPFSSQYRASAVVPPYKMCIVYIDVSTYACIDHIRDSVVNSDRRCNLISEISYMPARSFSIDDGPLDLSRVNTNK